MNETVEFDLRDLVTTIVKRIWIVVLCAVIVGASVLAYTVNFVTPQYEAGVTIYVNNNSGRGEGAYISSSDLAVALRLVATYVNIIESNSVLEKVIEEAGLTLTAAQVRGMISAKPVDETEMFKVTVTTPHPQLSADLANAIATVAPGEIAAIIEGSSAKIIDYARVPTSSSSPNYYTNTVLGAFCGAVLAIFVILMQNVLNVRVKNEDDLQKICDIPVLGLIPDMSNSMKGNRKKARR
jgi:capsular polysaccharide biosynthesis protein